MTGLFDTLGLGDANVRFVLLGSLLIGATGGMLGSFAVLRRRSLMGDALAHAALPGVALAFLLTGSKALPVLIAGATVTGVLGVLIIQFITNNTRIKADAALGIVLSVFFGLGIVLLTHIQQSSVGNQSGLDKFLFGQAAAMVQDDILVMSVMSVAIILVVLLCYKEFKALIFDPQFLQSLGVSTRRVDLLLMALIVLTVMVGLQAVGVVLIAAMLITPAVAARFWTVRLHRMVLLAAVLGGLSGAGGTFLSAQAPRVPTGPVMVMVATIFFVLSALFGPQRGLLQRLRRERSNELRERRHHLLRAVIELREGQPDAAGFPVREVAGELGWEEARVRREAKRLARLGLTQIERGPTGGDERLRLTDAGTDEGTFIVKSHRLWEHYLVYRDILSADHVDRPADEVEHLLTPELIGRLEELLEREQGLDPSKVVNIHESGSGYRRRGRDEGRAAS
jgi:manganese/zinc/iron transport system permease protein